MPSSLFSNFTFHGFGMKRIFLSLLFLLMLPSAARAEGMKVPETLAKEAIIIDYETGAVLYDKNANEKTPTSSMSKVMTAMLVFDAIRNGKLSLDQTLPVSEKAWRAEGSKMFVAVNSQVKVEDLIRGMIIQSGNDACVVLAEGVAGSEENFAQLLNEKAKEIGMTSSHFTNSNGWPDPEHYSTVRDLASMARYLIAHYPNEYKYYSEKEFTYNNIKQGNRNPLLYKNIGADGVKTGHTDDGGYGLIGSAVRDGRRVIMVMNGTSSMQERADEASKLVEWALVSFKNLDIVKKGVPLAKAPVVLGAAREVEMVAGQDIRTTVPAFAKDAFKRQVVYAAPLVAPISARQEVGKVHVTLASGETLSVPLLAAQGVPQSGFFSRIAEKFMILLVGVPKYQ